MDDPHFNRRAEDDAFAVTQWSVVLAAGRDSPTAARRAALAALCQSYWQPVYGYVRRHTASVDDAQDLTQSFFARLVEKEIVATATPDRGRFRAFLLTSVKNFLVNERQRARSAKRGGGRAPWSLDWDDAESRLNLGAADTLTPERSFERAWATALLDRVLGRLRQELADAGKAGTFDALQGALTGDPAQLPYEVVARELGCSPDAARQSGQRLRRRYRELLRAEVAATVADPADVDDELRGLFAVFGD